MSFAPIDLGVLNRLSASVTIANFPSLTVTAPYLTKQAIRLSPEGDATKFLEQLAGTVASPEPYQMMTITIHIVKTLALAAAYQDQFQLSTLLGKVTVRPDLAAGGSGLKPFPIYNCGLMTARELDFSGEDAGYPVVIRGTYYTNKNLWT